MRTTANNAKGTSGQSYVKAQFEELGWGAIPNPEHDLGTDLFLMARDARLFDLGALVGAQVKNWGKKFDTPEISDGEEGWWFADSEAHFEYWLDHRIPHIVVFYDKSNKVSYWVHITRDATVSTGKGRKIFVPKAQTVDPDHFDALVSVATSSPAGSTWEGSAWRPGRDIPSESRLRYALLVPRLIAPHDNEAVEDLTPEQAIAMVTAVRLWEIHERREEKQPVMSMEESLKSNDELWRLYGALLSWVENGDMDAIRGRPVDAPAHVEAARAVILAAALYEQGESRQAVKLIQSTLVSRDDYNPVDHAWLTLHLARNLVQIGRLKKARVLTLHVVPIGQVAPSDPTARFLTGVAADLLFALSGWQASDLEALINARDNAASWWRSQTMTVGLAKYIETSFSSWADERTIMFGGTDETRTKLRSTTLISGFAADNSNWAYQASLFAQYILMGSEDVGQIAAALDLLRLSGFDKQLKLAVERILERGPVASLQKLSSVVELERALRDSLRCSLELAGLAAPVMAPDVVDRTATWLLAEAANPLKRARALGLRFRYEEHLYKTLSRVYVACSPDVQMSVRRFIVDLPVVSDQSVAHNLASLIGNVPHRDWSDAEVEALGVRAAGDNVELRDALERLVAGRNPSVRAGLATRIESGDVSALVSWGDVRDLPESAAAGMIKSSTAAVQSQLASARRGAYTIGGLSPLRRLILLNMWHGESADWTACIEALADDQANPSDIVPGMELLLLMADQVPLSVRRELRQPLRHRSVVAPRTDFLATVMGGYDTRGAATQLLVAFFPEDVPEERILELLRGPTQAVVTGIRIIESREDAANLPLLAALSAHEATEIRAAVAAALGAWVGKGVGDAAAQGLLNRVLQEPGVELATYVTGAIRNQLRSDGAEAMLDLLQQHPSATVRLHVRLIREAWATAELAPLSADEVEPKE